MVLFSLILFKMYGAYWLPFDYAYTLGMFTPQIIYKENAFSYHLDNPNCRSDDSQEYFNIDGISYPRYVPLYYNKRIDFNCLNQMKTRFRILLWTTFVGTNDFHYGKYRNT